MRYLILCMLLMFAGNLTGETVSAQSFAQIRQVWSFLKNTAKKTHKEKLLYSGAITKSYYDYLSGKNSTSKDTLNATDSLDLVVKNLFLGDKSGQLMKSPTHKNSGLTSKDTINEEDSQVSSIEVIDDVNASRPKMFWEQLQGYVR